MVDFHRMRLIVSAKIVPVQIGFCPPAPSSGQEYLMVLWHHLMSKLPDPFDE